MSIKQIKSLVQFARGTSLIFDSLTTPIPDGVVVFAIDNGAFKLGDGASLYANLPILFKYEDLLGAQGGISALFKTISAADNGKIVVVELDTATSTVKYAVSATTLAGLMASIAALESTNTTQDADIAAVLATALDIDVSINTGMDNNVIVINNGRYSNSGTSVASIQAQVAAQSSNIPGSHLDEPIFYTTATKENVVDRLKLFDGNTYYVDVIGYNNLVPSPVFGITCSNTNVTITPVSGSLFSVNFNNITDALKTDIPVILTLSIDNGLGTSTVKKAVVCKVQRQRMVFVVTDNTYEDSDIFYGVITDNDDNIVCVGTKKVGTNLDACVYKFDTNLNSIIGKSYDGAGADYFLKASIDQYNNIYVIGQTSSEGGIVKGLIVKFDSNLNILARKVYGSTGNEAFYNVTIDNTGNIICVGSTNSESSGVYQALVVKFDTNLDIIARKRYGGATNVDFRGVAVDGSGNIFCVGFHTAPTSDNCLITKFDTNLNVLASKYYGGTGNYNERFLDVAVNQNGEVYAVGYTFSEGSVTYGSGLIVKFDNSLSILSRKYINGTITCNDVSIDQAGQVYVSGITRSVGSNEHCLVVKFDSNLNILITKYHGHSSANDQGYGCHVDNNGNSIYISHGAKWFDKRGALVLKYPANIPSGTFTVSSVPDLQVGDSGLVAANSTLTLSDSALTLYNSNLTLSNSALALNFYKPTVVFRDFLN
jgi:hypothetical protein